MGPVQDRSGPDRPSTNSASYYACSNKALVSVSRFTYHLRRSAIMTGGVDVVGLAGGHAVVGVRAGGAGERPGGAVSAETTGVSD